MSETLPDPDGYFRSRHLRERRRKLAIFQRQLADRPTSAETIFWNALQQAAPDLDFLPQIILYRFICDFYSRRARVVIEIDGPSHRHKGPSDSKRDAFLARRNIITLRFKNTEIFNNLAACISLTVSTARPRLLARSTALSNYLAAQSPVYSL